MYKQGEKELITAPLDGTILEGVTRQSVLDLARKWGDFKVTEAAFSMLELRAAIKSGMSIKGIIAPGMLLLVSHRSIKIKGISNCFLCLSR